MTSAPKRVLQRHLVSADMEAGLTIVAIARKYDVRHQAVSNAIRRWGMERPEASRRAAREVWSKSGAEALRAAWRDPEKAARMRSKLIPGGTGQLDPILARLTPEERQSYASFKKKGYNAKVRITRAEALRAIGRHDLAQEVGT